MNKKEYTTRCGIIHYWMNEYQDNKDTLVFLPGLTADHRLFERQIEAFKEKMNVWVWDAPGHNESRPFSFDFDLFDKATWLHEIIEKEGISQPILVGQSMGGYVIQAYSQLYPDQMKGCIIIDSAPLQRKYVTALEIWLLKRMENIYRYYPWKLLLKQGPAGVSTTKYGQQLMKEMMMTYDGNQAYYAKLASHGYTMLAQAMEKDLPYILECPTILLCGTKDRAGSCIRYNKAWHKDTGIDLYWIEGAGHNSNTDRIEEVNSLIETFIREIK